MFVNSFKKLSLAVSLLGLSLCLSAQGKLDSLQHLGDVVVVAKPFKEIIPVQRLSGQQLQRLNSLSVADALRYFAGVQIKDYGGMGGLKTVNVRNMGTHHVGVFYDGIQVGNTMNGTVDLGKFSLDDLDELTVYNGQKSEIFQSAKEYSGASTIYIRAKRPTFAHGKITNMLLRYKVGSIQLINPSFRFEQKLSNSLSISASGSYLESDGEYKFKYRRKKLDGAVAYDTTATRWNSDIKAYRAEVGLYGTVNDGLWNARLYYYDSDRGLPGAIVKNEWKNGERLTDKNFFAQGDFTKEITSDYKLRLSGKFAYDYTHYLALDTVNFMDDDLYKRGTFKNKFYQQEVYLSAVNMYNITPRWSVSLSTDFQYNKLNAAYRFTQHTSDTIKLGTPFSFPHRHSALIALATSINLGKFKAQASLLNTQVFESTKNNAEAKDKNEFSPAIFLGYMPFAGHDLNIRAFYKRVFRMPTFNDMYYTQLGYSLLKPEFTNQYNVGFTYSKRIRNSFLDGFTIQADSYYMNITDKIVAAPTGSQFRWMMTNMGTVEGYGIDMATSIEAHIWKVKLHSNLTYSYSSARDFSKLEGKKKTSYGDQIPYTPWHSGSVIFGASYDDWALNYSFIYTGERYDGGVNNIARNHVEPWYTHDLSFQKEFKINYFTIRGSVEVNNLFNQYYDVVLNYPMPGRNFRFVASVNF